MLSPVSLPIIEGNDTEENISAAFSCDLVTNARKHVAFLKYIHEYQFSNFISLLPDTTAAVSAVESLRRYKDLWLPMVAVATSSTTKPHELYPPPDIAWMWHCHRLAPKHYLDYCYHTYGRTIEANPPFSIAQQLSLVQSEGAKRTMTLWADLYPNESFFLDTKDICHSLDSKLSATRSTTLLHGFDLIESLNRQANFLWQVSGERFGDDDFLEDGLLNYYRFLKLRPTASKQRTILVPTYQIDLMWHTHILSSIDMYNADCMCIMNETLHHDDSLTDRSDGGVLDLSFARTKSLWMKEYGTDYIIAGGMYRGEPPNEYYTAEWRSYDDFLPSIVMNVSLIGKVGASSTGPIGPTRWASVDGVASNGKPSFIPHEHVAVHERKNLIFIPEYVLGRHANKTGYYHIETLEANNILRRRVNDKLNDLELGLAFKKACCGSPHEIQEDEKKRKIMLACQSLVRERTKAYVPTGFTNTKKIDSVNVNRSDGVWLYPPILYENAGGSCGGMVCTRMDGLVGPGGGGGADGCGDGGVGGGVGCGGGGCGGGGCGG